jgi:hypothetical protein
VLLTSPSQAIELRIGRIDIDDRTFPDGGLIDVNNVEIDRLGTEVQALRPHVLALDEARERIPAVSSVEDMSVALELPPHLLDHVEERLVFLPRYEV